MKIVIPEKAERIIKTLEEAGYEAYVVGGCVRDSILGRIPDDWDLTTSATPEQVKSLFSRTIDTGIQHGTVTVMIQKEGFEVTTFRVDGDYVDHRHPTSVSFTPDLREDLKRRDFTINAMAYSPAKGLIDMFGGREDLKNGIIRCVGNPMERFQEDALRMMRAVRFSAQLGFEIEEETAGSIEVLQENLRAVSAERIQTELVKLVVSDHPDYLRIAYERGITNIILPEFDVCMETAQNTPHHQYTVGEHILHSMQEVPKDRILRLTMLLHDIGKPSVKKTDENGRDHFKMHGPAGVAIAGKILKRLKFDNDTYQKVTKLVEWHDYRPLPTETSVRQAVYKIGEELFPMYLKVQKADVLAQSTLWREEKLERIRQVSEIFQRIQKRGDCISLKTLAVKGKDLIDAGFPAGKSMGMILNMLLDHVLEVPEDNEKEILLALAETYRTNSFFL
ncbi:MAG: CCA tRNA nucleotidyltransferase [Eubacteriales bacterium]|nr:CCA tRNA nucleotidyltransferase [Eubacteriales bacterium]